MRGESARLWVIANLVSMTLCAGSRPSLSEKFLGRKPYSRVLTSNRKKPVADRTELISATMHALSEPMNDLIDLERVVNKTQNSCTSDEAIDPDLWRCAKKILNDCRNLQGHGEEFSRLLCL